VGALPRLLTALFLAAFATTSKAQEGRLEVPKHDGWVTDLAGLLSAEKEAELETLMESYRRGSTHEIALLTIPSLQGEPIERFALEVGREWGLGTKEKNNGALLVVSKEDRKLRDITLYHLHTTGPAPFVDPPHRERFRSVSLFAGPPVRSTRPKL